MTVTTALLLKLVGRAAQMMNVLAAVTMDYALGTVMTSSPVQRDLLATRNNAHQRSLAVLAMKHVLEANALTACALVAVVMVFRAPLVGIVTQVSVHWFKRVPSVLTTLSVLGAVVLMGCVRATAMPWHPAAAVGSATRQRQSASSAAWETSVVTRWSVETVSVLEAAALANVANSHPVRRDTLVLVTGFVLRYLRNPVAASWVRRPRRDFHTLSCSDVSSGCF